VSLQVFTARISSRDPDRLDITRKSGTIGLFLAPSWAVLRPALVDMNVGQPDAWERYVQAFTREMRVSYRRERADWDALLARGRVVLVCYCTDATKCHRALLRETILPTLGAVDRGELA
jgi:hypothetical protein